MGNNKILGKALEVIFKESSDYISVSYPEEKTKKYKTYLNPAARRLLGIPSSKNPSYITMANIFPPWVRKIIQKDCMSVVYKRGQWRGKITVKNKKGKEVPISIKVTAHKDINGKVVFFSSIARDIMEFRQKELQALMYEKTLYEHIPEAVIITDKHMVIHTWNKAAEEMYGWEKHEVIKKSASKIIPSKHLEENGKKQSLKQLHTQGRWKGEVIQKRKDGTLITVAVAMSTLKGKKGEILGYMAINRDITENKKEERRKDDFINMASHELKTPLTSFKIYVHALQKKLEQQQDPQARQYMEKMTIQLTKLTHLVEELLDATRIEKGVNSLQKKYFSPRKLIKDIMVDFQPVAKQTLIIKTQKTKPVIADKERIRQVVINLLSNAIKYSSPESTIIIRSGLGKEAIEICVQDFGIGIPVEEQRRIFDRFYQVKAHATYPGLGLGLYISSQIIKQHGGEMWVESNVGKGSTFYFTLPIRNTTS